MQHRDRNVLSVFGVVAGHANFSAENEGGIGCSRRLEEGQDRKERVLLIDMTGTEVILA